MFFTDLNRFSDFIVILIVCGVRLKRKSSIFAEHKLTIIQESYFSIFDNNSLAEIENSRLSHFMVLNRENSITFLGKLFINDLNTV